MTSLYIHIPFCQRKCLYCSFTVFVSRERHIESYLDALEREAFFLRGAKITTVYIGGGTPSLLSILQLRRLVAMIREQFDVKGAIEWTLEANPEDVDAAKAAAFVELGFNRVSLGVQSFQERYLKILGRCHTADRARSAFKTLRQAGVRNINLDLMFGFPDQAEEDLQQDLAAVRALGSEHVSIYSLSVEPSSRFYVQHVKGLDQEGQARFYERIVAQMESAGFRQYEVSNFAQPGRESRHNLNYWESGNYIGLGVAAHSHCDGRRSWNTADLQKYLECLKSGQAPETGHEILTANQRLLEALVFGLRMNDGVDVRKLEEKFGVPLPAEKKVKIEEFIQAEFLCRREGSLVATRKGQLVLDELAVYLL